ncbi:unnamed protein product [Rhizopus stolonifer]
MNNETDVFIIGTGLSGLYAALLLSKMGVSIHMIENSGDEYDELLLLSPRILQLLHQLDVLEKILEKGTKHRSFDLYYSGQLMNALEAFDNDNVGFDYSLSIERSVLYHALLEHLGRLGISFPEENEELMKIEDHAIHKLVYLKNNQVWKTKIVLVENDDTNIVRQALGIAYTYYYFKKGARYFYTLEVVVKNTDFPSSKKICIVKREQYALYTLGHHNRMYITLEHNPCWTKINIDDEVPVSVALSYIKFVLEPYHIEFGKVESYVRWKGEQKKSELFEYDNSYFFIGPSSQLSSPRGFMDLTVYLEEIQNLCWKLAFRFRQCAAPHLLETIQPEIEKKSKETVLAAGLWLHQLMKEPNPSVRTLIYQLNKLSCCFVGDFPYDQNEINRPPETLISEFDLDNESSFEFIPPQETERRQPAAAGYLAPEGKLKPYSLLQILASTSETQTEHAAQPKDIPSPQLDTQPIDQNKPRKHPNSADNDLPNLLSTFQTKCDNINNRAMSSDRWKSIKQNYSKLNDRIQGFNPQGICFTLLVFCGPLMLAPTVAQFIKHLASPISFLHQNNSETCSYSTVGQKQQDTSLFSVLFISNATKQEATHYIHQTPPDTVHSHFPYGLDKVFLDHDQQCYKAYDIRQPEVVIIRPDGFIGTRIPPDYQRLCFYFNSFLTLEQNIAASYG